MGISRNILAANAASAVGVRHIRIYRYDIIIDVVRFIKISLSVRVDFKRERADILKRNKEGAVCGFSVGFGESVKVVEDIDAQTDGLLIADESVVYLLAADKPIFKVSANLPSVRLQIMPSSVSPLWRRLRISLKP